MVLALRVEGLAEQTEGYASQWLAVLPCYGLARKERS